MHLKSPICWKLEAIRANLGSILISELNLSIEEFEFKKSLDFYGLDSLRVAKVINKANDYFKVKLTFEDFERCDTAESLAVYILRQQEANTHLDFDSIFAVDETFVNTNQNSNCTYINTSAEVTLSSSQKVSENTKNSKKPIDRFFKFIRQRLLSQVIYTKTKPKIVGISSYFPTEYFEQRGLEITFIDNLLSENINIDPEQVNRFFSNVTLKGRHFALSPLDNLRNEEALNKGIEAAVDLTEKVLDNLLQSSDLKPEDISMVVESSLLPATPSIFARVMSRFSFLSNTKRMSLYGVGCMNGVHGVSKINDYLEGHPTEAVILISVELASVLWQGSFQQDLHQYISQYSKDPDGYSSLIKMTLITAALFGDGAVALLIVGSKHPLYKESKEVLQPQIIDTRSNLVPNTSHLIGVDILLNNSSFRATIQPEVPDLLPSAIEQTIQPLLNNHNLSFEDISHWILHPGGPKIIGAIEEQFELDRQALSLSWSTLKEKGNLSSAHVLYILEQLLSSSNPPNSGEFGLMIAMGPGLSQEAVLLKF